MLEQAAGIANHGAELELDGLEMRVDARPAVRRQGVEQPIAPEILICLRFGHSRVSIVHLEFAPARMGRVPSGRKGMIAVPSGYLSAFLRQV